MRVFVIGAGTMGSGIAQTCAFSGHQVVLADIGQDQLQRGVASIQKSLRKIAEKKNPENAQTVFDETMARISTSTNWEELGQAEFVIEAVFEDLEIKKGVFQQMDRFCQPDAILASNTSSIPITQLAASTKNPERVIGMHFMNPVPLMKLVEVIRGLATSEATLSSTLSLAGGLGKQAVEVRDFPGFVSNRILIPMLNESMFAVMEGVATAEAIDQVMKLGMNHPMGPLQLADFIGLDVCLDILEVLYEGFKDPKYRPCPLLVQMVQAGWLGKKTGKGFYDYT